MENNAEDYAKMHREQKIKSRNRAKSKYTKVECINKKSKVGIEEVSEDSIVL